MRKVIHDQTTIPVNTSYTAHNGNAANNLSSSGQLGSAGNLGSIGNLGSATSFGGSGNLGSPANMSELDTLLQDLSSARYSTVDKMHNASLGSPTRLDDAIKRPSVDSLLDELTHAQSNAIYAVPNR